MRQCSNCFIDYKVGIIVSDLLWSQIKPKNGPDLRLCPNCTMTRVSAVSEDNTTFKMMEIGQYTAAVLRPSRAQLAAIENVPDLDMQLRALNSEIHNACVQHQIDNDIPIALNGGFVGSPGPRGTDGSNNVLDTLVSELSMLKRAVSRTRELFSRYKELTTDKTKL